MTSAVHLIVAAETAQFSHAAASIGLRPAWQASYPKVSDGSSKAVALDGERGEVKRVLNLGPEFYPTETRRLDPDERGGDGAAQRRGCQDAHSCAGTETPAMPFIVGAPRSGTTLLRFMLDSHPLLCIPPETGFIPDAVSSAAADGFGKEHLFRIVTTFPADAPGWEDFGLEAKEYWAELQRVEPFTVGEGLRAFYRLYAKRHNRPRYGDKTPTYCEHIPAIRSVLPEAHFIHIIRDGRDTCLSLRSTWFAPARDMPTLAAYWSSLVRSAREAGLGSPAYMEVRYEELVTNPQPPLEAICSFLGLAFHPAMLRYWERTPFRLNEHRTRRRLDGSVVATHEQRLDQQRLTMSCPQPGRVFRWKTEMPAQEQSEFAAVAGETLQELGYQV